jgi:hypothetical protein
VKGIDGVVEQSVEGQCQAARALGAACNASWQCETTICRFGRCDTGAPGVPCENHFDCASRLCLEGKSCK